MEKAYDIKELGARLKDKGLDLLEDQLTLLVKETLDWISESAVISKTPYDDMAVVVIPPVKQFILNQVDKIDGEKG